MIINFPVNQNKYAEYCVDCHQEGGIATKTVPGNVPLVHCSFCGKDNERAIIIDPALHWWLDEKGQYWHKSVGIMIVNKEGKVLVIERAKFPPGYSLPAGHIDNGENPATAVKREAYEEVGLTIHKPQLVLETAIHGDSCRRGCDDHMWQLFVAAMPVSQTVQYEENEARAAVWMNVDELKKQNVPYAMRHLISNYKQEIDEAVGLMI